MDMQTPVYQQDDQQHGGSFYPTVLLVILLCVKWLRDHRQILRCAQDDREALRMTGGMGLGGKRQMPAELPQQAFA